MKLLSLVMTHSEAKETVDRHRNYWEKLGGELWFTSPENSAMGVDKEVLIGKAEHHGEISAQRIMAIFDYASEIEWDYILLMEYDSFALALPEEVIPKTSGVSAAKYLQNKPIKFKGKFYLHYPMLFTREAFIKVVKHLPLVCTNDRYYSDRFIGRAVEFANVPVTDLLKIKRAYSKNTIEPKHYKELRTAVKEGAIFFHGVKTAETLSIITNQRL